MPKFSSVAIKNKKLFKKETFRPGSKVGSSGANQALYGSYGHVTITLPAAQRRVRKVKKLIFLNLNKNYAL